MKLNKTFRLALTLSIIGFFVSCETRTGLKSGEGFIEVEGGKIWY